MTETRHPLIQGLQILATGGENALEHLIQKSGSSLQAAGRASQHPQNRLHQQEIQRITQQFNRAHFLITAYQSLN